MAPKKKRERWGPEQTDRLNQMFDEFVSSGGERGYDPRKADDSAYIIALAKEDDALRDFLVASLGGMKKNKNSDKMTRGYGRVASKYLQDAGRRGDRIPMAAPGAAAVARAAAPAPTAPTPSSPAPRTSFVTSLFGSVALFGFIRAQDIKAYIIQDGWAVRLIFNMRAELTDPEPLMMMNGGYPGYSESTSQYAKLSQVHRRIEQGTHDGSGVTDSFEVLIELPYECEKEFVDPFSEDDDLNVGNFPLDPDVHKPVLNAPDPCQKYLHVHCEEKNKKKSAQKFIERGYVRRYSRR